jgi:hypothetical protein
MAAIAGTLTSAPVGAAARRGALGRSLTVCIWRGPQSERRFLMIQQGQVFRLGSVARDGGELWAYRYRTGGRDSKQVQRGGFRSEADARAALERALEKQRRGRGVGRRLTLGEFVDEYLAQHEVSPVTLAKLRFLLSRAVQRLAGTTSTSSTRPRSRPRG